MRKIPSLKFLLCWTLLVTIINLNHENIGWAKPLDEAKEYRFKADQLHLQGQLDQAIVYYQKAIRLDRYSLAAYNGLAICYEKKDLFSLAETWYLRALEIDAHYAPAHANLALLYEKYGDIEKAVLHWKQRIHLGHPTDLGRIKARAKLAKYASDQLKEEDTKTLEQHIVKVKETGAQDEALKRREYKTREEEIQDYYLEGMQYYELGDFRSAAESFQKMIEALPFSD